MGPYRRFVRAWVVACALCGLPGSVRFVPSAAGEGLRYPPRVQAGSQQPAATLFDQGDVSWASDDVSLIPSIVDRPRRPSPLQLVQATEPAAPSSDAGAPATPPGAAANAPQPVAGNAENDYGLLGTAVLAGLQSVLNANASASGGLDAALVRGGHDAGTLLHGVPGVSVNARAPNMNETILRGRRLGQAPAKGSYWFPARQDLDTLMSKIDSQLVERIVTYKGPYSALYGPGLAFYDVQLLRAPNYEVGSPFQTHSSSILQYETNGEQWLGREGVWGGDDAWGFRGGYSHRGGSDYETGNGTELPSSYKSRQADLALGGWLTDDSRLDFQYLRLDQTDVEFPGQFFDINALVTDAYTVAYELDNQVLFDALKIDGWYNRTNFYGDNLRPGKRRVLPLDSEGVLGNTRLTRTLNSFTNVGAHSAGFRAGMSWGDHDDQWLTGGADLRYLGQRIDEINNFNLTAQDLDANGDPIGPPRTITNDTIPNPLPRSHSSNPGLFTEYERVVSDRLRMRSGARTDWVSMNADQVVPGVTQNLSQALGGNFDQHFNLGSGFLTLDYQLTDVCALNAGSGFAMRPPTMTEMYAFGPFVAVLPQYILTKVFGDPNLRPEKMGQVDIGASANYGPARSGLNFYHAWVQDYITFDFLDTGASSAYAFVNTPLATLAGFEAYGECDVAPVLTGFGTMSFVEGRDHSRTSTISRQRQLIAPTSLSNQRSQLLAPAGGGVFVPVGPASTEDEEPLPVIAPLTTRLGLRLHAPSLTPSWNVEFVANVVDNQDRVASSLRELITPGYTTYDILAYRQVSDNFTVTGGVRNLTDKYYQTYFDTRQFGSLPISTIFEPGISFFFGCEYAL